MNRERNRFTGRADEVKGKVRTAFARAVGDRPDEVKGKAQESKGKLKQAGQKVRSAFGR